MVSRQRGFSFAEVMIAAAILAILGSSLLGAQDRERVALGRSFDKLQAETAAQSVLEMLRTKRTTLKSGTTRLTDLPPGLRGTLSLEKALPGLLDVRIRIEGGQLDRAVVLETRLATEGQR